MATLFFTFSYTARNISFEAIWSMILGWLKKNNEESSNAPATRKGGSAELNCAPETRELKYFQTREYLQEMVAYSIKVKFWISCSSSSKKKCLSNWHDTIDWAGVHYVGQVKILGLRVQTTSFYLVWNLTPLAILGC